MGAYRVHLVALAAIVAASLGGCAGSAPPPPVNVVSDTFCQAAKKRTWSVDDTPESIQEAVRHNAGIDRACGTGKRLTS